MKRYIFFLIHIAIFSSVLANGQGIVFNSIKKSDTKWDELIELNNGLNNLVLQKAKIESSNDIVIRGSTVLQMSDAIIKCRKLIIEESVTNIYSNGNVVIDCVDVEFKASTAAPPVTDINFKKWNNASGKLTINYTGAFINNRRLVFTDVESVKVNFVNLRRR
jgi:hypothetical protein